MTSKTNTQVFIHIFEPVLNLLCACQLARGQMRSNKLRRYASVGGTYVRFSFVLR